MSKDWSKQQQDIFEWFKSGKGSLVVRARAGTGKTTTIIEALNYSTEERCLLAAFNKKIANELAQRIGTPRAEAKTLHSLGFAYLRKACQAQKIALPKIDNFAERTRIEQVIGVNAPDDVYRALKDIVALVKNTAPHADKKVLLDFAEQVGLDEEASWSAERLANAAAAVLNLAANGDGMISFDDMIWLPLIHDMVRPWYGLVVIDECQDMNFSQILLAKLACKAGGRIVVVGDDRQAIYGFRGADSGSLDRLKKQLSATELPLATTYRCGKKIVSLAQKLVPDYQAAPEAPEGVIDGCFDDQLIDRAKAGDFILSRKNAPLMSTCLRFLRAGIPCRIEGRDIGKQLASLVSKMKARSVPDFEMRVRSWADRELHKAEKKKNAEAACQTIEDQYETLMALADGAASVEEILTRCTSLFEDSIDEEGRVNKKPSVICSSVHKAKGLEADHVFILEWTLIRPSEKRPAVDIEEQNIEYVAITRAKKHLTWVVLRDDEE